MPGEDLAEAGGQTEAVRQVMEWNEERREWERVIVGRGGRRRLKWMNDCDV